MKLDITTLSTFTKRLQELRKDIINPQAIRKRKRKIFMSGFARSTDEVNDICQNLTTSPESAHQSLSSDTSSTSQGSQDSREVTDYFSAHQSSTSPSTPPTPLPPNQPVLQPHPQPPPLTASQSILLDFLGLKSSRLPATKYKKFIQLRRGIRHRATGRRLAESENHDRQSLRGLPIDESASKATSFYRSITRTASFDTAPKMAEQCVWGYVQSPWERSERLTVTARRRLMTWTWKGSGKVTCTKERPVSPGGTEYDY